MDKTKSYLLIRCGGKGIKVCSVHTNVYMESIAQREFKGSKCDTRIRYQLCITLCHKKEKVWTVSSEATINE